MNSLIQTKPVSVFANRSLTGILIFFLVYLSSTSSLTAQTFSEGLKPAWELKFGGLISKAKVTDKNFSSIPYAGAMFGALASINYDNEKLIHQLQFSYTTGDLKATDQEDNKLNQYILNIDYGNLYRIGSSSESSFAFKAGGNVNFLYAKRTYQDFINTDKTFELACSLSGAFEILYHINGNIVLSDRLVLPLISFVSHPGYGNTKGDSEQDFVSFSKFTRLVNSISLEIKLDQRQHLILGYNWDYYQLMQEH